MPLAPGTLDLSAYAYCDTPEVRITCKDGDGEVFPLAGWKAHGHIRKSPKGALVYDLSPVIAADDLAGLVTIPSIPHAATALIAPAVYHWDLILETPDGIRLPPTLAGAYAINLPDTQPTS